MFQPVAFEPRPVAKGGCRRGGQGGRAHPPLNPSAPPPAGAKKIHLSYCKNVNFRANVLNFAYVNSFNDLGVVLLCPCCYAAT